MTDDGRKKNTSARAALVIILACIAVLLLAAAVMVSIGIYGNGKGIGSILRQDPADYESYGYESSGRKEKNGRTKKEAENISDLMEADVGSYVQFGSYEQDNDLSNGKEPIVWLVLAKDGNRMLVISRYALDSMKFDSSNYRVAWMNSRVRGWLNKNFLNSAFSEEEISAIVDSAVPGDGKTEDTTDKVFLLSADEADEYFSSDSERACTPTKYAVENGAYGGEKKRSGTHCKWWLRSTGNAYCAIACVTGGGEVCRPGIIATNTDVCIRPAIWIDPDKLDQNGK